MSKHRKKEIMHIFACSMCKCQSANVEEMTWLDMHAHSPPLVGDDGKLVVLAVGICVGDDDGDGPRGIKIFTVFLVT